MFEIIAKTANGPAVAVVDDADADLATHKWHLAGGKEFGRYFARSTSGRTTYLHREIAARMGLIDPNAPSVQRGHWTLSIDHINGDKWDNRRSNLRLADRSMQATNRSDAPSKRNKSGVTGVTLEQRTGKWYACIAVEGRTVPLGTYVRFEDAVAARRAAELNPPTPRPRHQLKPCGTGAGWQRHRHNGEPPCDACRLAWNEECRAKQAKVRERKRAKRKDE